MNSQPIITLSREFGSGGQEIAQKLAQRFNLKLYDANILSHIADLHNLDEERLKRYDEAPRSYLFSRTMNGYSNAPQENVARMQFRYLVSRAEEGESFVVLGRCAEEVLRDFPGLISIFVLADIPFKQKRIMALNSVSDDDALEMMARINRKRKYYHNQFCKGKWGDSRNYDITVNSGRLGIDGTVDFLEDYIRRRIQAMPNEE